MAVYYSVLQRDVAHTARVSCQDIYSSATKLIVLTIIVCASFGVCLTALSQLPVQGSPCNIGRLQRQIGKTVKTTL